MKVSNERFGPIQRIKLRAEKTDEHYQRCLWADFYIDHEEWSVSCISDTGNYAYEWPDESDTHTFAQLLGSCIDRTYHLGKFCKRDYFNYNHALKRIKTQCDENIAGKIAGIDYTDEYIEFLYQLDELGISLADDCEDDFLEYSPQAEYYVELLTKYVLPVIKHGFFCPDGKAECFCPDAFNGCEHPDGCRTKEEIEYNERENTNEAD